MQNFEIIKFQGDEIPCALDGDTIWVAITPVAEAIGLNPQATHRAIKNDEILGLRCTTQSTVGLSNKTREMYCLPLEYVHGWLFSIPTNSVNEQARANLIAYKKECYQVLYNHFHGQHKEIERRIKEMHSLTKEKQQIEDTLSMLKGRLKMVEKALTKLQNENFAQLKLELPEARILEEGACNE